MELIEEHLIWGIAAGIIHLLGIISAINALLTARSSQSAIAWAIACITFPYLAIPAYWLLGRNHFEGYVLARQTSDNRFRELVQALREKAPADQRLPEGFRQAYEAFEKLAYVPFTAGNQVELYIDGDATFEAIFDQIREARDYILVQFFIVRADALGQRLLRALADKAREGVRVYFMYDRIGSHALPQGYARALREAGIHVQVFKTTRRWPCCWQINFRNHRKMVVVDGRWAATGGANLGLEYCGRDERLGYWRDTMTTVQGPAVQEAQLSFAEDWFFLTGDALEMNWKPQKVTAGGQAVLVLPTGPADPLPACSMMFTQAIHMATERLWITSPYFVPDREIVRALQLAALRGVDVRVLLPEKPHHYLAYWASFSYLEELEATGVKFFRYTKGILHQKVVLVDDHLAIVGSVNADNRSFYLAFELSLLVADSCFAEQLQTALEEDFRHSTAAGGDDFRKRNLLFRLAARLGRLLEPVL